MVISSASSARQKEKKKMAKISIENAEVVRHIAKAGFAAKTSYRTKSGETRNEYFTVWTEESPAVGAVVNIEGLHSAKVEEYEKDGETRRVAATHVNFPKITAGVEQPKQAQRGAAAILETFPGASMEEEAPF
jgi:hypothetical protein